MNRMDSRFGEVREKLTQWMSANRSKVQTLYQELPDEVRELRTFDDRLQDISEPLYVLAKLADAEQGNEITAILPRLLQGLDVVAGRRVRSERERGIVTLLDTVTNHMTEGAEEVFISTGKLLQQCERSSELNWITTGASLAGFLGHFGMTSTRSSDGNCRGYVFRREWVNQVMESYGDRAANGVQSVGSEAVPPLESAGVSEHQSSSEDSVVSEVSGQDTVLTA